MKKLNKRIVDLITILSFIIVIVANPQEVFGQRCPSTGNYIISTNQDWTAIAGLGTCDADLMTDGGVHTGDIYISYSGANNILTFNVNNLTIEGNLDLSSTSNGNTFTIAPNTTLTIIGDLGDPTNNNLQYVLGNGSVLIVTGTIYGKNNNTIDGSGGFVSAGSVDFQGDLDCGTATGCPVLDISDCTQSGTLCEANNTGQIIV